MSDFRCAVPKGYKVVYIWPRNHDYVCLRRRGEYGGVPISYSLSDPTYNEKLPSQLTFLGK